MTRLATIALLFCCVAAAYLPHRRSAFRVIEEEAGCTTPDWGNVLDEGFQTPTTGYEQSWTEVGTTANIDPAYDISALSSGYTTNELCSQGWQITVPTDGTETYAYWDNGSEIAIASVAVDVVFWLYTITAPTTGKSYNCFTTGASSTAGTSRTVSIIFETSSGQLRIRADASSASANINLSAGEWYRITLHLDTTAASSSISVNDGTPQTFTRYGSNPRYFHFGATHGLDATEDGSFIVDLISITSTP